MLWFCSHFLPIFCKLKSFINRRRNLCYSQAKYCYSRFLSLSLGTDFVNLIIYHSDLFIALYIILSIQYKYVCSAQEGPRG